MLKKTSSIHADKLCLQFIRCGGYSIIYLVKKVLENSCGDGQFV